MPRFTSGVGSCEMAALCEELHSEKAVHDLTSLVCLTPGFGIQLKMAHMIFKAQGALACKAGSEPESTH